MRPAMRHADGVAALPRGLRQAIVSLIAVELECPVEAPEERLGVLSAPARGIEEDHPWRFGYLNRPGFREGKTLRG